MTDTSSPVRILVVEDEYLLADAITDALKALGAHVVGPIGQLSEALALMQTATLDGAVLDINLRGEMVFPLADALTARGVPYVFTTGYGQENIPARYKDIPILPKPVDVRLLEPLFRAAGG